MKFTAEQIAGILGRGINKNVLSKIEEGKEGSLTFVKPKIQPSHL
jgi:hypothetical protein